MNQERKNHLLAYITRETNPDNLLTFVETFMEIFEGAKCVDAKTYNDFQHLTEAERWDLMQEALTALLKKRSAPKEPAIQNEAPPLDRDLFFEEAFRGYLVPDIIKDTSTAFCTAYRIRGICDPMYIANVIAKELGVGDGASSFNRADPDLTKLPHVEERLRYAYSTMIKKAEGAPPVAAILERLHALATPSV